MWTRSTSPLWPRARHGAAAWAAPAASGVGDRAPIAAPEDCARRLRFTCAPTTFARSAAPRPADDLTCWSAGAESHCRTSSRSLVVWSSRVFTPLSFAVAVLEGRQPLRDAVGGVGTLRGRPLSCRSHEQVVAPKDCGVPVFAQCSVQPRLWKCERSSTAPSPRRCSGRRPETADAGRRRSSPLSTNPSPPPSVQFRDRLRSGLRRVLPLRRRPEPVGAARAGNQPGPRHDH